VPFAVDRESGHHDSPPGPVGIAESDGFSTSEGEWADGSRDEDAVLVYYAGHAAARRFDPSLPADPDLCGATDDYERASMLLPALMGEGETPEEAQAGMEQAAAAFVEGPISAVAEPTPASTRTSHRRGVHRRRGLARGVGDVPEWV